MDKEVRITEVAYDYYDDQSGVLLRVEVIEHGVVTHRRWEWIPDGLDEYFVLGHFVEDDRAAGGSYQPLLLVVPPPW